MELCWDNVNKLILCKNGWLYNSENKHYYDVKKCKKCGIEYIGRRNSKYCSKGCIRKNETHTEEARKLISIAHKDKKCSDETREKISKALKGRKLSSREVEILKRDRRGKGNPMYGKRGSKSPLWKGGYTEKNIPLYDTYAPQLEWVEEVRRNKEDSNVLEVKCTHCKEWFIPRMPLVYSRVQYLKGNYESEGRFYCSDKCRNICPLYHKSPEALMKEDAIRAGRMSWLELNREVQTELRQMVLECDGYACTKCGSTENLHCHHIMPVAVEPLLSADIDNCITLCEQCHREVHSQDGCRYGQLRQCITI